MRRPIFDGLPLLAALWWAGGCIPQSSSLLSDTSNSDVGAETALAPADASGTSGLEALALNLVQPVATTTSVAYGAPVSVQPEPIPDSAAFYIPPPDPNFASTVPSMPASPPPENDPPPAQPQRPGYFHGRLGASVSEQILSTDPNVPHGDSFSHGDSVEVLVRVTDQELVSYTIPGYVFNSDEPADATAAGETTTVVGTMPTLPADPPGWFRMEVTITSLDQGEGWFELNATFTLTGHAGSMGLSGTGTHSVSSTWSDGAMNYHSFTDYHVTLSASAAGAPPVSVETRQTFTIDGELTE